MPRVTFGPDLADIQDPAAGGRRRRRRGPEPRALRLAGLAILAASLWTAFTIATFGYLPRYQLPGESFLETADFLEDWQAQGNVATETGVVRLESLDPDETTWLRRTIQLPRGRTSLRLGADVAATGVTGGREDWHQARVYLVQLAPDGAMLWDQPHLLVELSGTTTRHRVEQILETPSAVRSVMLALELSYAVGRFDVANLELALLDEQSLFRLLATILVAGWCLLIPWCVWRVHRSIGGQILRRLLLVTLGLLLAGIFMPASVRQHLIDSLATGFGLDLHSPDMVAHAVIFCLLALLVRCGRPGDPLVLHLACWVLASAVTEVLQMFTADRSPEIGDWLANLVGAGAGLALAELGLRLDRLIERRKRSRLNKTVF